MSFCYLIRYNIKPEKITPATINKAMIIQTGILIISVLTAFIAIPMVKGIMTIRITVRSALSAISRRIKKPAKMTATI